MKTNRIYSLDILRVLACFLVILQHASEYYYITPSYKVDTGDNTFWIGVMTSIARTSVPLFVMLSGYFLLPLSQPISVFFRKRFTRILSPFVVWCVLYAVYYVFYRGDSLQQMWLNIACIPVNFGTQVGHLWYIYMLVGLYLLVPVISPWIEKASKKELQCYLGLWAFTTLLPYIHQVFPDVLGECTWNASPTLHYFTGFVGYLVAGCYMKKYGPFRLSLSIPMILVGYAVTAIIFCSRIHKVEWVNELELSWEFCSLNVAVATVGLFSLFQSIKSKGENPFGSLVRRISDVSYGMYLAHIMILNAFHDFFVNISNVLIVVPLITVCSFVSVYIVVGLLSQLPGRKYWIG